MSTKKTANKKAAKKATPKARAQTKSNQKAKQRPKAKASPAKQASRKQASQKQITAKYPTGKGGAVRPVPRRPPNNPDLPLDYIADMEESFRSWRDDLEDFARHLRALDRKRLNGVGMKKMGFIERALTYAAENPEFLPNYLSLNKFQADNNYFLALRSSFDVIQQVEELLWNIITESSDVIYTDSLDYYASVREASKRRVDPAETIFSDLSVFFKSRGRKTEDDSAEPTAKQLKRDFNALRSGKRDGKIVIENVKPRVTGGSHKVIDEKFSDNATFKETAEGEIRE